MLFRDIVATVGCDNREKASLRCTVDEEAVWSLQKVSENGDEGGGGGKLEEGRRLLCD